MAVKSNAHFHGPAATRKAPKLAAVPASQRNNDDANSTGWSTKRVRFRYHEWALAVRKELHIQRAQSTVDVSDGNLSAHARPKLEEAKYLTARNLFEARRSKTVYRLTVLEKNDLNRYLAHVEAVIAATRHG